MYRHFCTITLAFITLVLVSACSGGETPTDSVIDANAQAVEMTLTAVELEREATENFLEAQPTATMMPTIVLSPTPLVFATSGNPPTAIIPPTAFIPPTVTPAPTLTPNLMVNNTDQLLTDGRGLTTGSSVTNGEFEVEGYCNILNPEYDVREDGTNWYCIYGREVALTLRRPNFTDICRRTYDREDAFALNLPGSEPYAYRWRCVASVNVPTPTQQLVPNLLLNGTGLTTGNPVTNGEFEVEGYCSALNPAYGVDTDGNRWYCTQNGQRVLTLGSAEFDDICFRTYNNPGAFAQQINNTQIQPAYRWRCYVLR